jgi:hypothetical protein
MWKSPLEAKMDAEDNSPRKVDLFIVGAQKSGTTALSKYLMGHPSVMIPEIKELHFFDNEDLDWEKPDYSILHRRFSVLDSTADTGCKARIWGEATPIYMFWPYAMKRISEYNPNAKIAVCLRHPSYRAYSHWRMEYSRGREALPFDLAISEAGRKRIRDSDPMSIRIYTYLERGFYSEQVTSFSNLFSSRQVIYIRSDHLIQNPARVLKELAGFLEIDEHAYAIQRLPRLSPVDYSSEHYLDADNKARLDDLYADDIIRTSGAIGLDLRDWLDPSYSEPVVV